MTNLTDKIFARIKEPKFRSTICISVGAATIIGGAAALALCPDDTAGNESPRFHWSATKDKPGALEQAGSKDLGERELTIASNDPEPGVAQRSDANNENAVSDDSAAASSAPPKKGGLFSHLKSAAHWMGAPFKAVASVFSGGRSAAPQMSTAVGSVEMKSTTAYVKSSPDASLSIPSHQQVELSSGDVFLVTSKRKMVVSDKDTRVTLNKNASALVTDRGGVMQIQNLVGEANASSVMVTNASVGNVPLTPGNAVCIAKSKSDIDAFMRKENNTLGVDHCEWATGADGTAVLTYEFRPADVMTQSKILQDMKASEDDYVQDLIQSLAQSAQNGVDVASN